ncbi:MAG: hypothetical protein IGQ45_10200 [Cyanobacterium sp. T60_A2020_053]|nr:hypothetical protein [Cyanobacterium sp. T60_A2020_053]
MNNSFFLRVKGGLTGAVIGDLFFDNPAPSTLSYPLQLLFKITDHLANFHNLNNLNLSVNYFNNKLVCDTIESAIIILPIILYYHRDNDAVEGAGFFRQQFNYLNLPLNISDNCLSLLHKLIISSKKKEDLITILKEDRDLKTIKDIIDLKHTLTDAEKIIADDIKEEEKSFSQSIYLFFSVTYDLETCLLRSKQFQHNQQLIAILTGFLWGFSQSYFAIPYALRKKVDYLNVINEQNIDQLTDKFMASWQGLFRLC